MTACLNIIKSLLSLVCEEVLTLSECYKYQVVNTESLSCLCRNLLNNFLNNLNLLNNLLWLSVKLITERVNLIVQLTNIPNLEVVCTIRSLKLVVKTYEKTELSCLLTELYSIARTVARAVSRITFITAATVARETTVLSGASDSTV